MVERARGPAMRPGRTAAAVDGARGSGAAATASAPRQRLQQACIARTFGTVAPVQFGREQKVRQDEVEHLLRAGARRLGAGIGALRPYLGAHEQNLVFLAGLIGGRFHFDGLAGALAVINASATHAENNTLQRDIAGAFGKVIGFKEAYSAVVSGDRNAFRDGRAAEFEGLAAELSAAARMVEAGKTVSGLGTEMAYDGGRQVQEVDLVVEDGPRRYLVEVAATPSKLRDKIDGGLQGRYPQMQGYRALAREHEGSRVAYFCPTLRADRISDELIGKIEEARVLLVLDGEFCDAGALRTAVEESRAAPTAPVHHTRKSHKQTERQDREPRLRDRGPKPSAKSLLAEALAEYEESSDGPEPEDDFDDDDG